MGLCIYHGGCTDGVAAAWAVWTKHPNWTFYPGVYQQEPPWDLIAIAGEVMFVDFSYKLPVMRRIAEYDVRLTVIDHHKTAEADLAALFGDDDVVGIFDMDRCGALLTWDTLWPDAPRPELLTHIDARDRWIDDPPLHNDAVIIALRSYDHSPSDDSPAAWDGLMDAWAGFMHLGSERLADEGVSILRYYRQRVDETKRHASTFALGEYRDVPLVNAPYYLASEVAGELAVDAPDKIAAVWWQNKGGDVTFSLRSRGDVDVGVLATKYGGGGHPGAAGFKVDGLEELIAMQGRTIQEVAAQARAVS